jgi:chromosome segregation ATPase
MSHKVVKRELDCQQNDDQDYETISKRIKNEPIEQQMLLKNDELNPESLKMKLEVSETRCKVLEDENQLLKSRLSHFNDANNQLNYEIDDLKFLVKNKNQQLISIKTKYYTEMDKLVANYEERITKYESNDELFKIQSEKSLLEVQLSVLKQEHEAECYELKNKLKLIQDEFNAKARALESLEGSFREIRDKLTQDYKRLEDEFKRYKSQSSQSKSQKYEHRRSVSERVNYSKENCGQFKDSSKSHQNSRRHVHIINDNDNVKNPLNIQITTK